MHTHTHSHIHIHTHTHKPTEVPCDKGLAEVKDPTVMEVVQTENTVDMPQT